MRNMLNPWRRVRELEIRVADLEADLRLSSLSYDNLYTRYGRLSATYDNALEQLHKMPKRDPKTGRMVKAGAA